MQEYIDNWKVGKTNTELNHETETAMVTQFCQNLARGDLNNVWPFWASFH